jgi:hypothetical protein
VQLHGWDAGEGRKDQRLLFLHGTLDDGTDRHRNVRARGSAGVINILPIPVKFCHLQKLEMCGNKPE